MTGESSLQLPSNITRFTPRAFQSYSFPASPNAAHVSHLVTQCRRLPCSVRCISSSSSRLGTSASTTMSLRDGRADQRLRRQQDPCLAATTAGLGVSWHVMAPYSYSEAMPGKLALKNLQDTAHNPAAQLACPACGCRRARRWPSGAAAAAPGGSSCTPARGHSAPGVCCHAAEPTAAGRAAREAGCESCVNSKHWCYPTCSPG